MERRCRPQDCEPHSGWSSLTPVPVMLSNSRAVCCVLSVQVGGPGEMNVALVPEPIGIVYMELLHLRNGIQIIIPGASLYFFESDLKKKCCVSGVPVRWMELARGQLCGLIPLLRGFQERSSDFRACMAGTFSPPFPSHPASPLSFPFARAEHTSSPPRWLTDLRRF